MVKVLKFRIFTVPPPPPQNVSVEATSSTSLKVTWSIALLEHFKDILQRYEIDLKDISENATENISLAFNSSLFAFEKDGLKEYHDYSISMAVGSTAGMSNFSPWMKMKTLEDGMCNSNQPARQFANGQILR